MNITSIKVFDVGSVRGQMRLPVSADVPVYVEAYLPAGSHKVVIFVAPKAKCMCMASLGSYSGYRLWASSRCRDSRQYTAVAQNISRELGLTESANAEQFVLGDYVNFSINVVPAATDIKSYLDAQIEQFGDMSFSDVYGSYSTLRSNPVAEGLAMRLFGSRGMTYGEFEAECVRIVSDAGGWDSVLLFLRGYERYLSGCHSVICTEDISTVMCSVARIRFLKKLAWPFSESSLVAAAMYCQLQINGGAGQYLMPVDLPGETRSWTIQEAILDALDYLRTRYPVISCFPEDL